MLIACGCAEACERAVCERVMRTGVSATRGYITREATLTSPRTRVRARLISHEGSGWSVSTRGIGGGTPGNSALNTPSDKARGAGRLLISIIS